MNWERGRDEDEEWEKWIELNKVRPLAFDYTSICEVKETYTISGHLQSRRVSWLAEEDHTEGQGLRKGKNRIVEVASGDDDCRVPEDKKMERAERWKVEKYRKSGVRG